METLTPDIVFPPPMGDAVTKVDRMGRPLPGLVEEPDWTDLAAIESAIADILVAMPTRKKTPLTAASRYAPIYAMIAAGTIWRHILKQTEVTMLEFRHFCELSPKLQELRILADITGEDIRKTERRDKAHEMATVGLRKPIWQRNSANEPVKVDEVMEPMARILELERKADEPGRYVERSEVKSTGVQVTFMVDMGREPETQTVKAKSIPPVPPRRKAPASPDLPEKAP